MVQGHHPSLRDIPATAHLLKASEKNHRVLFYICAKCTISKILTTLNNFQSVMLPHEILLLTAIVINLSHLKKLDLHILPISSTEQSSFVTLELNDDHLTPCNIYTK